MYLDPENNANTQPHRKRSLKFLKFQLHDSDVQLLSHLTEEHRALLLATGSYRELAEQFAIPIGTVRSRLHRARARLETLRHDA